jgi:hypothetical protein
VAFFGLAGAIFAPLAFEVQRPPPKQLSDVLADTVVKIKDRVTKREAPAPAKRETDWRVVAVITASALGFIVLKLIETARGLGLTKMRHRYAMPP